MNEALTTIASFSTVEEAALAKNKLTEAGINTYLDGENTVFLFWCLDNALGGIKLQVSEQDAEAACEILEEHDGIEELERESLAEESSEDCRADALLETTQTPQEDEPEPNPREKNAEQALRLSLLMMLFAPFQFYTFWVIYKVYLSDEPIRPRYIRKTLLAVCISITILLNFGLLVKYMFLF